MEKYSEDLVCASCGAPALVIISRREACGSTHPQHDHIECIMLKHSPTIRHFGYEAFAEYRW